MNQKLLVLNDWLAENATFDMSYIMNIDGSDSMQAENPQPHNNYDAVYGTVYNMYKEAILEELKNSVKEQFTYEMFIGTLGENADQMSDEEKEAAYDQAILSLLADEKMTTELGMPYEEFVEMNAKMAAEGLTPEILNYWEGSIFGTLGEGSAVCLGYSRAYAYLVQAMHPEIYLKNGTDLETADNWKSYKEDLHQLRKDIDEYFRTKLKLKIKENWQVFPTYVRGIDFVGFRSFMNYKLLRKSTCKQFKRKMTALNKKRIQGLELTYSEWCSINSYKGWLIPCNSYRLSEKYVKPIQDFADQYYLENIYMKGGILK